MTGKKEQAATVFHYVVLLTLIKQPKTNVLEVQYVITHNIAGMNMSIGKKLTPCISLVVGRKVFIPTHMPLLMCLAQVGLFLLADALFIGVQQAGSFLQDLRPPH